MFWQDTTEAKLNIISVANQFFEIHHADAEVSALIWKYLKVLSLRVNGVSETIKIRKVKEEKIGFAH